MLNKVNWKRTLLIFCGLCAVLFVALILFEREEEIDSVFSSPFTRDRPTSSHPSQALDLPVVTFNSAASKTAEKRSCGDYVMFANSFSDGRRLGNQMFNLAAGVMVAQLTDRSIAVNNSVYSKTSLEDLFDSTYKRFNRTCDTYTIDDKWNLAYNPDVEALDGNKRSKFANKTLVLTGYFQSWKYALNEYLLRDKYFVIKRDLKHYVRNFFDSALPAGWRPDTFVRVGIHVRRGDVLYDHNIRFGYTTPEASYFRKAMLHMMGMYKRVQFIIASNDHNWTRSNLTPDLFKNVNLSSYSLNITYSSVNNDANTDMALLASCHHSIMSTGTYGWWAAWLSRGTTTYYKTFPRQGSPLEAMFKKEDFFPPHWIGMSN